MPDLERIHQKYKDQGLVVLGIHRDEVDDHDVAEQFAREEIKVTYPLVVDVKDRMFNFFGKGLTVMPMTIFINKDGFVETRVIGPRTEEEFEL